MRDVEPQVQQQRTSLHAQATTIVEGSGAKPPTPDTGIYEVAVATINDGQVQKALAGIPTTGMACPTSTLGPATVPPTNGTCPPGYTLKLMMVDERKQLTCALMIYCARGDVVDMAKTLPAFGLAGLRTVRDHLRDILA